MTVFTATPGNAAIVARMLADFNAEFETPCPPLDELTERLERLLDHEDVIVLVSGTPEEPEGVALVTLRPTVWFDGPLAVLDELYVVPPLRDQGRGTEIIETLLADLRSRGCEEIHINVDAPDVDTRRFYERHGFTNVEPATGDQMLCYIQELPAVS